MNLLVVVRISVDLQDPLPLVESVAFVVEHAAGAVEIIPWINLVWIDQVPVRTVDLRGRAEQDEEASGVTNPTRQLR